MSRGNGNGRISKYNSQVAEKAGTKKGDSLPYAPDFLDSLARRMAIAGDSAERCLAWLIYRANGNQSIKAIHLYSRNGEPPVETGLEQKDCALELAWVEAGHRVEWLDAPLELFREEAARRGVKAIDKSTISRGFQFNRDRGTMETGTGFSLVYVPAPDATRFSDVRESCRTKGENVQNTTNFKEWAKLSYAREFQEYEVARARERELLTFLTARYKKEKGSLAVETNGGTSLEALESLEPLRAPAPSSPAVPCIEKTHSVGRSSEVQPPTERPADVPENSYKSKIRDWLERKFAAAIPGFDLRERELDQIAATIHNDTHLKQFQEAAARQTKPRGWIVFVRIAQNCQNLQPNYQRAMTEGAIIAPESDIERMQQMLRTRLEVEQKLRGSTYHG